MTNPTLTLRDNWDNAVTETIESGVLVMENLVPKNSDSHCVEPEDLGLDADTAEFAPYAVSMGVQDGFEKGYDWMGDGSLLTYQTKTDGNKTRREYFQPTSYSVDFIHANGAGDAIAEAFSNHGFQVVWDGNDSTAVKVWIRSGSTPTVPKLGTMLNNTDTAGLLLSGADLSSRKKVARKTDNGDLLRVLAGDADASVRVIVAGNPATPQDCLFDIAGSPDRLMRLRVAGNPNLPHKAFLLLATAEADAAVRTKLAGNQDCPADILTSLSGDTEQPVRTAVARNRNTSRDTFIALMEDAAEYVRKATVDSRNITRHDLRILSSDSAGVVRKAAVMNNLCPPDALISLAAKEHNHTVLMALVNCPHDSPMIWKALINNKSADSWFRRQAGKKLSWQG